MEELKLDDMKEKVKKTQRIVNNLETNNIHIHLKVVFTIIEKQLEDEIWCENCKTWHAPRDESATPSIK